MGKTVKNHTCSLTIAVMDKVSKKGVDLSSLKWAQFVLRFCLPIIANELTYVANMGWEGILLLKIYTNCRSWK